MVVAAEEEEDQSTLGYCSIFHIGRVAHSGNLNNIMYANNVELPSA